MKGTIVKVVAQRGFAFLRDEDGNDRFVHVDSVIPVEAFYELREGSLVDFDPIGTGERSLRAINVRIESTQAA